MWLLKKPLFVFTTQKHCFLPSSVTSWQPFHLSPAADVLSQFPPVKPEHGHCPCHQDCVSVSPHSGAAQTTLSILCAVEEQHRSATWGMLDFYFNGASGRWVRCTNGLTPWNNVSFTSFRSGCNETVWPGPGCTTGSEHRGSKMWRGH